MSTSLSRAVEGGDSLTVDLARRDFECEVSETYKGYIVRSRLKRVPNEAVKCNAITHEEKVRRFPFRYIQSVKFPDGHVLRSNREMREVFRAHIPERFTRWTDLTVQEFCSYIADFPCLPNAEVASCKGLVNECEVRDGLKQDDLNKLSGLDGLRNVLEAAAYVFTYSDRYIQPLVRPGSHPWERYQGHDHIAEESWQVC